MGRRGACTTSWPKPCALLKVLRPHDLTHASSRHLDGQSDIIDRYAGGVAEVPRDLVQPTHRQGLQVLPLQLQWQQQSDLVVRCETGDLLGHAWLLEADAEGATAGRRNLHLGAAGDEGVWLEAVGIDAGDVARLILVVTVDIGVLRRLDT